MLPESFAKLLNKYVYDNSKNMTFEQKEKVYLFAIETTKSSDCMMKMAILYESRKDYQNAGKYYLMALEFDSNCPVINYNFADMCMKMYNQEKDKYWFHRQFALRYYTKAADLNDLESLMNVVEYSYLGCYLYDKVEQQTTRMDHYLGKLLNHPDYQKRYCDSLTKKLNMLYFLEQIKCIPNAIKGANRLKSDPDVMVYRNKVQLFQKLDNICECPICYIDGLNIDLKCGHCFCTKCYEKIYKDKCPLCRA